MKELVEQLVQIAKERINKEKESSISADTFRLLSVIERLAVYL